MEWWIFSPYHSISCTNPSDSCKPEPQVPPPFTSSHAAPLFLTFRLIPLFPLSSYSEPCGLVCPRQSWAPKALKRKQWAMRCGINGFIGSISLPALTLIWATVYTGVTVGKESYMTPMPPRGHREDSLRKPPLPLVHYYWSPESHTSPQAARNTKTPSYTYKWMFFLTIIKMQKTLFFHKIA